MSFIEMTGATLETIIDAGELHHSDLVAAGVTHKCIVRVNKQGDIEVRRPHGWDVVGGLIGDFETRVQGKTGLHWA
jgi:hypothetical protein